MSQPGPTTPPTAAERRAHLDLPYTAVHDHFIGGSWRATSSQRRNDVTDPATGEVWGSVPDGSAEDVDAAVASARESFDHGPWRRLPAAIRATHLLRIAEEVERRSIEIAATVSRENGTPIAESSGAAANAAGILRYFAGLATLLDDPDERAFPTDPTRSTLVHRDPIGVCALIAPWNFPINLMVIKLAPALLTGCSVVMKPASPTPLSFRYILDACRAAGVPEGVVNLVTGSGRLGDALVRHRDVDKVAFTGSTPVGRSIAAAAGELLRPVTLELGGKSSALVLPDADLDLMASRLIKSCLRNTGQTCYISTRILAPSHRYAEIVDMVAETVRSQPQGDPLNPETVFGPCATASQFNTVRGYAESGLAEGAIAITGGRPSTMSGALERGYFMEPTVFSEVTPEMRIAREEIFGPVLTVLRYDDLDNALEVANNTSFGLGGIVFGEDEEHAQQVARRMDTGSVGINFFASNHAAPFGGRHDSGLGTEYGPEGLAAYLSYQSVHRSATRR
ncbi:aldehyde dehydrogenase family protein [Nesterenkonia sp. LB17]|uniref:aldehyde dehydrogenase family protein n=1 Tax=unclassified Nesterenkonia TaxID=2629769 RepID=UPI001F4CBFC9|nr:MULTISPECIES: aldehyde dehydrogenase family protein [unclassified Nesterenkonia]MCH8564444.1 aldehyde dehydrogenase family protein [Nesterenkonia sp. LB17]MCH8570070.1 aldehyde dehydrogenase family protein [Nesterenkonia sp. AY15]